MVPIAINSGKTVSSFRGVGPKKISIFGTIKCKTKFRNRELINDLFVLLDEEAVIPLLFGRDLLANLMSIFFI